LARFIGLNELALTFLLIFAFLFILLPYWSFYLGHGDYLYALFWTNGFAWIGGVVNFDEIVKRREILEALDL